MMRIGFLVFPDVQQLDLTGPFEAFASWPQARVDLVWKTKETLVASTGLRLQPDLTFADAPQFDVLCMPGGRGVNPLMLDDETLEFLRSQAQGARFVTSVCTGALVLGAARLLQGKRATTHWAYLDLLPAFGAIATQGRVVRDGSLMTGGGVTAGIDLALALIGEIAGPKAAQAIQLQLEYAPKPPFDAGHPSTAPQTIVEAFRHKSKELRAEREGLAKIAAERLGI